MATSLSNRIQIEKCFLFRSVCCCILRARPSALPLTRTRTRNENEFNLEVCLIKCESKSKIYQQKCSKSHHSLAKYGTNKRLLYKN